LGLPRTSIAPSAAMRRTVRYRLPRSCTGCSTKQNRLTCFDGTFSTIRSRATRIVLASVALPPARPGERDVIGGAHGSASRSRRWR
jgi:hypothetical protein